MIDCLICFVLARNMNSIYGFKGEVQHKYDDKVMSQFTKVFNLLPLAAVIQDKVRTERPMLIAVA